MKENQYSLIVLKKILNAELIGSHTDAIVSELLIDSRKLVEVNQVLFIAIKGKRNDGADYVTNLYNRGVRNFMIQEFRDEMSALKDANFLIVHNVLKSLQSLAAYHRSKFKIPVVGITGSNGKTIVKEWLFQLLRSDYNTVRSPKSYNSQVGVPLSVWQMKSHHQIGIFEAGISFPNEMENLEKMILPTVGIFTNIGHAHGRNFKNDQHKIIEKLKLFQRCNLLIYCKDNELLHNTIIKQASSGNQFFSWSKQNDSDLIVKGVIREGGSTNILLNFKEQQFEVTLPFTDRASYENVLHCICYLLVLNTPISVIKSRVSLLKPIGMRLELKEGLNNCIIINDAYSSDLESLKIALDFVNQQEHSLRKTVFLSDMLDSSLPAETLYKQVASLLQKMQVSKLIGVGKEITKYAHLFDIDANFYANTSELLNELSIHAFENEVILLKGARSFQFETIAKKFIKKAHATTLEVDLNALISNYQWYKSQLKPDTKVMAMVKAFSYGTGGAEIAKTLQFHRLDYLGVAYIDEGVELRKSGIHIPIMVMNPEPSSFDLMIKYRLEPEIFSLHQLYLWIEAIGGDDAHAIGVHLKLDTGMHRLGFSIEELPDLLKVLHENPLLKVISVFTHLVGSDNKSLENFTKEQFHQFENAYSSIATALSYRPLRHVLNTKGVENYPDKQYEMVRLGIGLYGIGGGPVLRPVAYLKSKISQIKSIAKGQSVGYNRSFIASKSTVIATIPIGYADGLNRHLGNGVGSVSILGKRLKIVGDICMDMCFVDVTDLKVEVGDEVEFFGVNPKVEELAASLNTIPYEILTSVSRRVKRVYFQE